ncbi:unnamed protein product [Microthlaspi erraticum]|uniref:NB-ARC domain-containing protein n=1 Tax=Microthlaspi erraticum TaxID=1685480 RepID=A0A6D2JIM0_9BRAS|nr:unnamed protein product [Microthlaspi erraticum]
MVDAITGFVVGKMGNYLIEEASRLMGIKDELEELKTELMCIQGYLKDVEAREKEDEASKVWTKLVLDIAYDVEDVLDRYNMKAEERSQRRGMRRLTNKIGETKDAYKIVDDIKTLKSRIMDVTRKRETYGIGNISERRGGGNTSSFRVRELRRARSVVDQERVVGLEDNAKVLLEKLLNDDGEEKRYMISIFGMGGLGKTALARKLYNLGDVKERFEYRAWTYVSQEYNIKDMLMRIIRSLGVASGEEMEKIRMFAEEDLEVYLYRLLQGKKYLVVVDDIWKKAAWESLKRALPRNHNGSRVIITTRIKAVAEGVDERVYAHKLRKLTFEESWNLFEQKAFRGIKPVDKDLERIGKEMVTKCDGLPLAIVVLGGLMSRKRPNEWNDVYATLWRRLKNDSIHFSTVFDLSFKELQHEMKLCFLYLSVFPEDYEIDVEQLICLLVAEGFIQEDEEMMEDVARYYIEELIDRSLLETVRLERGKAMSCKIHDLLRDVAVEKAKELNFVNVYKEQHSSSTTCRREVVHHLKNTNYLEDRRVIKRMRSLLFFGERSEMGVSYYKTIALKMKLLRVLNMRGIQFVCESQDRLPDVIGGLIHLRYLGIADTSIKDIPAFISNLRLTFLQTLDASRNYIKGGRTDLRNLTSLRHVMGRFVGELLIGDAVNIQTLRSISSYTWSKLTKHELLQNLRDLEIADYSDLADKTTVDFGSFSNLTKLRVLKLDVENITLLSESKEAVGYMDVILPSLESLTIVRANLEEDLMSVFQKFPRLEDLVLEECDYPGRKMSISAQGFCRLRKLELTSLVVNELRIEEEAMPNLMQLDVRKRQPGKMMIPDRLRALLGDDEFWSILPGMGLDSDHASRNKAN